MGDIGRRYERRRPYNLEKRSRKIKAVLTERLKEGGLMREKYIKVRLSATEMKQLKDLACFNGLTVSSFVRWLIQNYKNEDIK